MEPFVSIICNTYNHEKYIRDALDGFIMQKTDFPFEILVHDDASTDKTADIIREYEAKYPDLISAIYQTENQYSKDERISMIYQYPRVKGKYIAICEGDDFWTDPLKLQKQINALEEHPEVDMCVCCAAKTNNGVLCGKIMPSNEDCIIPVERVIEGGGDFVATCTHVIRTETAASPMGFRDAFPYDYSLQIRGALRGGLLYLSDCMATYRIFGSGSWTAGFYNNREKRVEISNSIEKMLSLLDAETEGKYSDVIQYKIKENEFYSLNNDYKFKEMLSDKYREVYKKQSFKNKLKIHIRCLFPKLVKKRRERNIK